MSKEMKQVALFSFLLYVIILAMILTSDLDFIFLLIATAITFYNWIALGLDSQSNSYYSFEKKDGRTSFIEKTEMGLWTILIYLSFILFNLKYSAVYRDLLTITSTAGCSILFTNLNYLSKTDQQRGYLHYISVSLLVFSVLLFEIHKGIYISVLTYILGFLFGLNLFVTKYRKKKYLSNLGILLELFLMLLLLIN